MNGKGPSGILVDFAKTQVFWIDYQWLGAGRARFGFIANGSIVACHEFYNDNTGSVPYMNTADLPMRMEIFNTGIAAAPSSCKMIIMALVNEGSAEIAPSYISYTADNGTAYVGVSNGVLKPILSIQPKLTFAGQTNRIHLLLEKIKVLALTNNIYWRIVYNGALTGASFNSVDLNSAVNKDIVATAISGGVVVASGYAVAPSAGVVSEDIQRVVLPFTLDYNGLNPDTFTLVGAGVGAAASVAGAFSWVELR